MAKVHIITRRGYFAKLEDNLSLKNFPSWDWSIPNGDNERVSNLSYKEILAFLQKREKEELEKNPTEEKDQSFVKIGGLFRIRWRHRPSESFVRTAKVKIAYGFKGQIARHVYIESTTDDILYIGKARDVMTCIRRIFSSRKNSNSIGRKIAALLQSTPTQLGEERETLSSEETERILAEVVFDFIREEHPVKREFMKAYAVGKELPCLNIVLEH